MEELLKLPPITSAHGHLIDELIYKIHWLMFALFIGWTVYYVYVLIRFRQSKNPQANYTGTKTKFILYLTLIIAAIELVELFVFSLPVWANRIDISKTNDVLEVRIVAEQFAWNIHYPGNDGKFGTTDLKLVDADNPLGIDRTDANAKDDIITINQFNLPVNKPIYIHLTSKDVIHSLNLPYMRVKQDAIPGISVPVQFEANTTTKQLQEQVARYVSTSDSVRQFNLVSLQDYKANDGTVILAKYDYISDEANTTLRYAGITHIRVAEDIPSEIACAQLCGLGHFRMRGYMNVQTTEEFEAWMKEHEAELNQ
ncbi:MAG: hypothetical protein FJ218_08405 [Ignavibacteria bacterium]|nr:hypothetical protein [Ignavibacteria bacterium]